jgi:hypothetical protein
VRADEQKPDVRHERWTSRRTTAKSLSVKGAKCISGGCARKAVEITPGGLHRVPKGTKEVGSRMNAVQKSAEGVVGIGNEPAPKRDKAGSLTFAEGPNGAPRGAQTERGK